MLIQLRCLCVVDRFVDLHLVLSHDYAVVRVEDVYDVASVEAAFVHS